MAVLKEDLSVFGRRKDSFKASKFGSLRVSSSQPRRLDDSKRFEEVERSGCLVNIEKIDNNFPSFKVGPCQLQRKPRETKSAELSLSIRNLALSIRAARFSRRRESVNKEESPERESLPSIIGKDLDSNNLKVDLREITENHTSNDDDGELSQSFCKENSSFKESCQESKTTRSGKSKKKKRSKTATKIKVKRKISLKDVKKKHSPRVGKLKICNDEEAQKSIIETLSLTRVTKIRDAYTKTRLSPRHNKSLPSVDHKLILSPNKSQNSLCDPEDIAPTNRKSPARSVKVYLSEKHSGTVMGIPAVPPGTPGLELQKEIEWVPSLSDIKSQRSITMKLSSIVARQRKKEKQEKLAKELRMQEDEKRKYREMQAKIKQRQRAEIYALNKILTEVENEQYERLKKEKGLPV